MGVIDRGEVALLDAWRASWPLDREPIVVDVGANVGDYTAEVLQRFPLAFVLCVEPQRAAFKQLVKRFGGHPRVGFENCALGAEDGTATLRATKHPSCYLATLSERTTDTHDPTVVLDRTEEVEVRRLDDLPLPLIDWLKLDVEGHEYAVLQGAQRLLSEGLIGTIQFEFAGHQAAEGVTFLDFWGLLSEFQLYRVDPDGEIKPVTDPTLETDTNHRNYYASFSR